MFKHLFRVCLNIHSFILFYFPFPFLFLFYFSADLLVGSYQSDTVVLIRWLFMFTLLIEIYMKSTTYKFIEGVVYPMNLSNPEVRAPLQVQCNCWRGGGVRADKGIRRSSPISYHDLINSLKPVPIHSTLSVVHNNHLGFKAIILRRLAITWI